MIDTLKSSGEIAIKGAGGILLSLWDALPDILRVGILAATLIHIIIRIRKDLQP